jgi:hypothetical protein
MGCGGLPRPAFLRLAGLRMEFRTGHRWFPLCKCLAYSPLQGYPRRCVLSSRAHLHIHLPVFQVSVKESKARLRFPRHNFQREEQATHIWELLPITQTE